jgi:hypothetical protein
MKKNLERRDCVAVRERGTKDNENPTKDDDDDDDDEQKFRNPFLMFVIIIIKKLHVTQKQKNESQRK